MLSAGGASNTSCIVWCIRCRCSSLIPPRVPPPPPPPPRPRPKPPRPPRPPPPPIPGYPPPDRPPRGSSPVVSRPVIMARGLSLFAALKVHWPERSGGLAHNGVPAELPSATTAISPTQV